MNPFKSSQHFTHKNNSGKLKIVNFMWDFIKLEQKKWSLQVKQRK